METYISTDTALRGIVRVPDGPYAYPVHYRRMGLSRFNVGDETSCVHTSTRNWRTCRVRFQLFPLKPFNLSISLFSSIFRLILQQFDSKRAMRFLEIGCGSGAISLALLKSLPKVQWKQQWDVSYLIVFFRRFVLPSIKVNWLVTLQCPTLNAIT